ncbi:MAG: DUF6470 family protein [Peptococcaceae bacterium]|nr:DUF6470 family protein [Peptococcaceae bacterium]
MAVTLSIHQELGQIGLKTQPRRFDLQRTPCDINIDRIPAAVNMVIEPGDLRIDYTQMQNSLGYGSAEFITQTIAAEARQVFEADLKRTVNSGDAFAQLHRHMTVSQWAAQAKYFDNDLPEMCLEYIMPPEIHYEPREVITDVQLERLKINGALGKVEVVNYAPAVVDVYLEREPLLEITTEGWAFDFEA